MKSKQKLRLFYIHVNNIMAVPDRETAITQPLQKRYINMSSYGRLECDRSLYASNTLTEMLTHTKQQF